MPAAKPVTIVTTAADDYEGPTPQPLAVIGDLSLVEPQPTIVIDETPADATAVAVQLADVVAALEAAGILTA